MNLHVVCSSATHSLICPNDGRKAGHNEDEHWHAYQLIWNNEMHMFAVQKQGTAAAVQANAKSSALLLHMLALSCTSAARLASSQQTCYIAIYQSAGRQAAVVHICTGQAQADLHLRSPLKLRQWRGRWQRRSPETSH